MVLFLSYFIHRERWLRMQRCMHRSDSGTPALLAIAQEYIDIMGKTGRGAIGAPGTEETNKGTRRMPRLSEAKKDAASCEKPRSGAHSRLTRGSPNGTTHLREQVS